MGQARTRPLAARAWPLARGDIQFAPRVEIIEIGEETPEIWVKMWSETRLTAKPGPGGLGTRPDIQPKG